MGTFIHSLEKGTHIRITTPRLTVTGYVISAVNWGDLKQDDWYIEIKNEVDGFPHYWKQQGDSRVLGGEGSLEILSF